ncbi:MAG: hypothetical protein ACHBNF_01520 [Chromatiales bacterium]
MGTLLGLLGPGVVARAAGDDGAGRRAEVQINLCSEPGEIIQALALEPAAGGPTEAWYFDNAGLDLSGQGLVVRLRRKAGESELTLKAADQDCTRVPPSSIPRGEGKCEYDLHGTSLKGAVSLSRSLTDEQVQELLAGRHALTQALSPTQIAYLREVVHAWPLASGLQRLGPVRTVSYRSPGRRFVVEVWHLPSGGRFIELSQKTSFQDALRLSSVLADTLARTGVQPCDDQASRARAKLEALLPAGTSAKRAARERPGAGINAEPLTD